MEDKVISNIRVNGTDYKLNTRICLKRVTEEEFRDILLPKNGYYRAKDVYINMDTFETVLVYDPNCCATHNKITRYDYIMEDEMKKLDRLLEGNIFFTG